MTPAMTRPSTSRRLVSPSPWRTIARSVPADILSRAGARGIAIFPGSGIVDVEGSKAVTRVKLGGAHAVAIDCDAVGMAGGWSPVVHLSSHGGIKPRYDEAVAGFVPGGFPASHFGAGAMMGTLRPRRRDCGGRQRRSLRRIARGLRQDAAGLCA